MRLYNIGGDTLINLDLVECVYCDKNYEKIYPGCGATYNYKVKIIIGGKEYIYSCPATRSIADKDIEILKDILNNYEMGDK